MDRRTFPLRAHAAAAWIVVGNALLYASLRVDRAWPLAAVALAPWTVLAVCARRGAPWIAFASAMPAFALMHRAIGRHAPLSHLVIAVAYAAALVPSAWLVRQIARRTRAPLSLTVGLVWSAAELVRTLGFVPPWHRLAVALSAQLRAIQIADVAGMSGVSCVLAFCGGAAASAAVRVVDPSLSSRRPRVSRELVAAGSLVVAVTLYGSWRLREAREAVRDGPRVLVVETDVLPDTLDGAVAPNALLAAATALTRAAYARGDGAALIQWPELTTERVLNPEFHEARADDRGLSDALGPGRYGARTPAEIAVLQAEGRGTLATLTRLVDELRTPLLVGATAFVPHGARWERRNAMFLLAPGRATPVARHDKVLTFPVYESLPLRDLAPRIAARLARLRPPHSPREITPGRAPVALPVGPWTVHSPICFETEPSAYTRDWLPEAARGRLFWSHGANDWWGERSDDVLHAFRFEVFRAIEGRVGIARSANAGFAGFVSPTGALHDVVGGARAAQMPAPGRPERAALARLNALRLAREALQVEATRAPSEDARRALRARAMALTEAMLDAAREARARALAAAVTGARTANVRIDRRRPLYPRVGRFVEGGLVGAWAAALLVARARARR